MRMSALLVLCLFACRAPQETTPPRPEPQPEPAADETNTYVSDTRPDAGAEAPKIETDAAEAQRVAAEAGIAASVDSIEAARALADGVADQVLGAGGERLASPALVRSWPARDPALVYVYFPLTASKKGMNTFTVGIPIEVTVDLVGGTTQHKKLKASHVMTSVTVGRDSATVRHNIELAERTLHEILLQRRPVERSLALLDGYREWFNAHLDVMTDLLRRMPDGVKWLRTPSVQARAD